jgi:ABC-type glycerol-3-phosphate transport system permease component
MQQASDLYHSIRQAFRYVQVSLNGALFAFVVMVLVPGLTIFLMAQKEFIRGLTSGATKG